MSVYDERPWLALYDDGLPADIELDHENGLEMFDAALSRGPERALIHYFGSTLTLRDVDGMADALAVALRDLGVNPGDRIAVYLQNVPQFILAMLATWKAGGIMISINPMWREREIGFVLNDSEAAVLLTLETLYRDVAASVVPETKVRAVITTSELEFVNGEVPSPLTHVERHRDARTRDLMELMHERRGQKLDPPTLRGDDIAFLTYTSGTTGPPKGAMNTHRNLVFTSQTYRDWTRLTPDEDVVLGIAPLFHVTGLIGHIGVCLLTPVPLVLAYRFDPAVTLGLIERHRPTFTIGSITVFISLMDHPDAATRDLSSLTKIWSGGAPIPPAVTQAFEQRFGAYIHGCYGLTETTSPSHVVPFARRAPVDEISGALSVGVPVWNTVVRIRDDDGNELPAGEVGEICTRGPQVVPGYWRKPQETENAIPDGELHTGDIGFMDEQGWFYVVDRKKDQINAAGYKVWPREVEDVLYEHPAVREAAVVGVPDSYRGETVKAFVSLKAGESTDEPTLIAFCRQRMAAYKYPRHVEIIDELPKNAAGKVLRRELRARSAVKA
jgi:long-chain acyl-CoA synthetase